MSVINTSKRVIIISVIFTAMRIIMKYILFA